MSNLFLDSYLLNLSTSEDGTKLFGKMLVCPLDVSNRNGKGIKKADLSEDELDRLKGQPIVCKVIKNTNGYDFGSHEMKRIKEYNAETKEVVIKTVFDTNPIGYIESTTIEDVELENGTTSCIIGNVCFWTRYENATKVLVDLFNKGNLSCSWELYPDDRYVENGVEWLKGITWIGIATLGSNVKPAYPDSGVIELSEVDEHNLELIEAFTQDCMNTDLQSSSKNNEDSNINNLQKGGNVVGENNVTVSSLTQRDINRRLYKLFDEKDTYMEISMIYPSENRAICYSWNREKDEDFIEISYKIENDEVSLVSEREVKMLFVPREAMEVKIAEKVTEVTSQKEKEISELKADVESKSNELLEKVNNIVKLGEELSSKDEIIKAKDTEMAELLTYKEEIDRQKQVKLEAELSEKRDELRKVALKGGYITEADIEASEEIKAMINNLEEDKIKIIIADRVIAKTDGNKDDVVTSSLDENQPKPVVNLNGVVDANIDSASVMAKFLSKKIKK